MVMTEAYLAAILRELIDENPIACRGILRIARIVVTDEVPTLAVTLGGTPQLKINLAFVATHCHTEAHVKAVILHEFLHVLLGHTERFARVDDALNLALDIVINAIIHRTMGTEYSDMMGRYYAGARGLAALLRPMTERERVRGWSTWEAVYEGTLVVDDLLDLARTVRKQVLRDALGAGRVLLGNHADLGAAPRTGALSSEVEQVLRDTMRAMNGSGIWRAPKDRGIGALPYETVVTAADERMARWERAAWQALRQCILPDRRALAGDPVDQAMRLPVLHEQDRRGFLHALWSPLIPDATWVGQRRQPRATAQVYLDVSGSMHAEMPLLLALLRRLRHSIRTPFWAFSDAVAPAVIEGGQLRTQTSGGTSINSVLRHVAATRPARAVIVTDGYIEVCDPALLARVSGQRIYAILSRDGSAGELERAGIPYIQLDGVPT